MPRASIHRCHGALSVVNMTTAPTAGHLIIDFIKQGRCSVSDITILPLGACLAYLSVCDLELVFSSVSTVKIIGLSINVRYVGRGFPIHRSWNQIYRAVREP